MDKYGNMTRREACYFLGISESASDEQIKRAYRYKAKLYHPDANPNTDTKEYYIRAQKAYECLMRHQEIPSQNQKHYGGMPYSSYGYQEKTTTNANANREQYGAQSNVRPAKVYSSTAAARANYQRQKAKEKELEKLQKWDEEQRTNKKRQQQTQLYGTKYAEYMSDFGKSKEEEVLEKIRAIWLAETIKRQIDLDREHKEALQRRKIYRAFMQQKIKEEDSK